MNTRLDDSISSIAAFVGKRSFVACSTRARSSSVGSSRSIQTASDSVGADLGLAVSIVSRSRSYPMRDAAMASISRHPRATAYHEVRADGWRISSAQVDRLRGLLGLDCRRLHRSTLGLGNRPHGVSAKPPGLGPVLATAPRRT